MPYGPKGQWRPAETRACAVHVMKIATGQIEETYEPPRDQNADHAASSRNASKAAKAAKARAASQTPERRKQVAATAAAARWGRA